MTKYGDDWGHIRRSCSGEGGGGRRGRAGGRCEGRDQETRRACAKGTTAAAALLLKRVAGKCCTSHARLRLWARRLQLTREQGITLRGSAGIVAEIFSKSSSPRPELGRAEPRPSRRRAAPPPPRRLGAAMARSGPAPSPRGPARSARAEESAERRMPAPRSGRGANAFGINSILYQRGTYPSETFTRVQKYGLTVLVITDRELIKYLNNVVEELKDWLYRCSVPKLVVVISDIESGEVLERWQFDTECDKTAKDDSARREKSEIRSVIRQITATVTFLPLLEVSCSFDLRIYTDKDLLVPEKWEESGPQFITNFEEVHLCSFTTTFHKVNSMVAYKIPVND
ncbi:LOW QUALITY PROTEIN: mitotic spindle assembly checkpoint protein MAD2A-like [Trichechus inunguis]